MSVVTEFKGSKVADRGNLPPNGEQGATGDFARSAHRHVRELIEADLESNAVLSPQTKERIRLDLGNNATADYSRMNLTIVYGIFGCDTRLATTHWRIAKILDGINYAFNELKICANNCAPSEVVTKIYRPILAGEVNTPSDHWSVTITDDNGDTQQVPASLSDFARLLDIINTNRNLGAAKQDLRRLVNAYFNRQTTFMVDLPSLQAANADDDTLTTIISKQQNFDIFAADVNPRDDYADIAQTLPRYIDSIKNMHIQIGLQMVDTWRGSSGGHREMGGHAYAVSNMDSNGLWFIPLSGRMAADITAGDLQKMEKGGMMGQPQELGEMDEDKTGAVVRFRLRDLEQRQQGTDVRNTSKTTRVAKAMVGLTLLETGRDQKDEGVEDQDFNDKISVINLCGKKLDGKIITAMHAHYDKAMKKIRGFGLSDDEAADLAFTDVFAPCIINNPNDWITAVGKAYGVGSGSSLSLVANKEKFPNFVVRIRCRDVKDEINGMPIRWLTFKGMRQLLEYVAARAAKGHIDQPGAMHLNSFTQIDKKAQSPDPDVQNNRQSEFALEKITSEQGQKIAQLVRAVLAEYSGQYLSDYVNDQKLFWTVLDKNGNFVPHGQQAEGQKLTTFDLMFAAILQKRCDEQNNSVLTLLGEIYDIDFEDQRKDVTPEMLVRGLADTLNNLSTVERKKIPLLTD